MFDTTRVIRKPLTALDHMFVLFALLAAAATDAVILLAPQRHQPNVITVSMIAICVGFTFAYALVACAAIAPSCRDYIVVKE
ncbi:MAG: hypothetical protein HY507_02425 [Candidatus Zambryskibacteria bacterium]|nr:hypothetical protein [Candidatus Zambryskibacteria bacterium]